MAATVLDLILESLMSSLRLILTLMSPNCLPVPTFFVVVLVDQPLHDSSVQPAVNNVHPLCNTLFSNLTGQINKKNLHQKNTNLSLLGSKKIAEEGN